MHKFHSLNVVTCFPPMSEVFFSTDLCRHHTFCGGVSRVVRAMAEKTPEKTRSRSPVRVPDEPTGDEIPKANEEGKPLEEITRETPKKQMDCPKLHWPK